MVRRGTGTGRYLRLTGIAIILGGLAGCEDGAGPSFLQPKEQSSDSTPESSKAKSTKLVERDVESPEVFQVTEAALWDGRPSLGGVWVAHPDVTDPHRVIIRNTANDKFVIGALFRRERDIPGPRIQASSDAADALAMLAGAPVQLNVTALVRESVDDEPVIQETTAALEETSEVDESTLDPIAGAAAAIDASEAIPTTIEPAEPIPTVIDQAEPIPTTIETDVTEPVIQEKKRKFVWPWSKPKPAEAIPTTIDVGDATVGAGTVGAGTAIAATTLPAAAAPAEPPKPAPSKSSLNKPFIQIGIFSDEDNADRTATQMRSAGIIPTVYEQSSNGKTFWRVLVGPAKTKTERSALLEKVKKTGFSDAYYVTN